MGITSCREEEMLGETFLAVLVFAMKTGHSFTFTLPQTGGVSTRYHSSSRSNTGSFEKKESALGMATWSNGELEERCQNDVGALSCVSSSVSRPCFHKKQFRASY